MNKRILLVDDDINILKAYLRNLRLKYDITVAESGMAAIKIINESEAFALVLSDYRMPEMDGVKFLSEVKKLAPDTVRMMLTGYADVNAIITTINEGNVFRFLTKPCPNEVLVKALNDGIEQYRLINSEKELLEKTLKGSIKVLIDILSIVNPIAFSKAARIRNIIKRLGKNLDESMQWKLEITALLSQIGCVAIPTEILEKRNNHKTLTIKEKELFLTHPQIGRSLIENIPRFEEIAEAIAYQYKRYEDKTESEIDSRKNIAATLARLLKHAVDLDSLLEAQKKDKMAIEFIKTQYDISGEPLDITINELDQKYSRKNLFINHITPGMLLAEDIIDRNGIPLVGKGTEITTALLARLNNFASLKRILEPITVYVPR
jgi:CheY-like chemotaxis protein